MQGLDRVDAGVFDLFGFKLLEPFEVDKIFKNDYNFSQHPDLLASITPRLIQPLTKENLGAFE